MFIYDKIMKKNIKMPNEQIIAHANEIVDVQIGEDIKKMTRVEALLSVLFIEGFKNKNIQAIKEYLNIIKDEKPQSQEQKDFMDLFKYLNGKN